MPAQQKCAQFAARRAPARSQPHSPTMDHESMSLRPTSKPMYENLKTQFARLHPAEKPPSNVEFQPPPYCKVVNADTNQPVTVTSEVTEIVGWPSDDGSKIRFEISTPAEDLNPFWSWMQATFGVGGKIADSLEKNYSAMGTISTPTTRVLAKRCLVLWSWLRCRCRECARLRVLTTIARGHCSGKEQTGGGCGQAAARLY